MNVTGANSSNKDAEEQARVEARLDKAGKNELLRRGEWARTAPPDAL